MFGVPYPLDLAEVDLTLLELLQGPLNPITMQLYCPLYWYR